jgi:hypothetical protein
MLAATAFLICCSTITTPVMNDSGIPADDHSSASTHELKRGAFFGAKIIPVTGEVRERLRLGAGAGALIDQVIAAADDETPSALERDPNGWTDLLAQAGAKLEGWTRGPIPPRGKIGARSQWSLDATTGILVCQGDGGHEWLRWDKELEDCVFHVEWRFTVVPGKKGYNSGIYARNSADATVWHQAQTGDG